MSKLGEWALTNPFISRLLTGETPDLTTPQPCTLQISSTAPLKIAVLDESGQTAAVLNTDITSRTAYDTVTVQMDALMQTVAVHDTTEFTFTPVAKVKQ